MQAEVLDHAVRRIERVLRRAAAPAAGSGRFDRTEQRVGFVDQRDVGLAPRDLLHVRVAAAMEARDIGLGEDVARGGSGQRGEAEEVVHELGAGDDRPAALECFAHLGTVADTGPELGLPPFGRCLAACEGARDGGVGRGVPIEDAGDVADFWADGFWADGFRRRGR